MGSGRMMNKQVKIRDSEGIIIQHEEWKPAKLKCPFCPCLQIWERIDYINTFFCSRCGKGFIITFQLPLIEIKNQRIQQLANTPKQLTLFKEKNNGTI